MGPRTGRATLGAHTIKIRSGAAGFSKETTHRKTKIIKNKSQTSQNEPSCIRSRFLTRDDRPGAVWAVRVGGVWTVVVVRGVCAAVRWETLCIFYNREPRAETEPSRDELVSHGVSRGAPWLPQRLNHAWLTCDLTSRVDGRPTRGRPLPPGRAWRGRRWRPCRRRGALSPAPPHQLLYRGPAPSPPTAW
jgi:hypothetical protein